MLGDRSEAQRLNLVDHPDCNSQGNSVTVFRFRLRIGACDVFYMRIKLKM